VVHLEGGSSEVPEAKLRRRRLPPYYYEGRNRYFARTYGRGVGPLLANGAWLAGRAVASLRAAVLRDPRPAVEREGADQWQGWLAAP
jgi:hypothetical protein